MSISFLKSRSKKTVLGLDIGSKNTKILGFQKEKNKLQVSHFCMAPTPDQLFLDGKITDPSKMSDFIAEQLLALDISNSIELVLSVSGKGMIAKKIDIPEMEDYMIPEYVEIESEQELFYNKDEMYLDYQILENLDSENQKSKSIFVMTILKQAIDNYTDSVPNEIASCYIIDTNWSSLYNVFEYNMDLNPDSNYMIIDSGCSMTNIIVVLKNQIVFTRNISFGGDFFTQNIAQKMSLDYSEAENLKITASKGDSSPEDLISLLKGELCDSFVEEIISCYQLYLSFYPEKSISEVYITGGNSQTLGLKESLESKLNLNVQPLKSFKRIKPSSDFSKYGSSTFYSVAAGLALRGLE